MLRPTTCKEAIARWEAANKQVAAEATDVQMQFQWPPIDKMDGSLSSLVACKRLSLSTNTIEKIQGIAGMKNLTILALGRNNIKNIIGLETVGETLEELWISYNLIEKLKGIHMMKKLKNLIISHNLIATWSEVVKINECPTIISCNLIGNPIYDSQPDVDTWRNTVEKKLPNIIKLDEIPLIRGV